ncbi:MAG: hypothetical protein AAFW46_15610 [Pseudomonadota bacterium]
MGAFALSGAAAAGFGGGAARPVFFALLACGALLQPLAAAVLRGDRPAGRAALTGAAWSCWLIPATALLLALGERALGDPAYAPAFVLPLLFARGALVRLDPETCAGPISPR